MSVLVVDDVVLNRRMLRRCLEAAGAGTVLEASCGQTAYEVFKAGGGPATFALILMDCRMPNMDGWQATEHIRLLERACGWAPVPIVACTTEDITPGAPAAQRCWECGMNAATVKPLTRDAAAQLLQQWAGAAAAAGSCRSSDNSSACVLADSADSSSAGRSSLDSEDGCLPQRFYQAISCGLYSGSSTIP